MSDNIKNIALCHACGNYIDSETHQKLCMETIQFQCQVCEKGFKKLRYLKEHVKIHTNDSLYQCDKCPCNQEDLYCIGSERDFYS